MESSLAVIAAAMVLDRVLGDPPWLWRRCPHPVVLFGGLIGSLENWLNDHSLPFGVRRCRGVMATAILVVGSGLGGFAIAAALSWLPFGPIVEAVIVAIFLAQKSLLHHVAAVRQGLAEGLQPGRQAVSMIVGRNPALLDEAGVARASIESAAENFSDGLVAPVLCYAVLGLPGLLVFKLVNTADSMIGHRSPRYEAFGWAAARLDDLLNFVPARLSALLLCAAAALSGRDGRAAFRAALRDAPLHRSPNAGWPEAAAAGALGLALGGPRRYGELIVDGAWLNASGRTEARPDDITAAIRLVDLAWALLLAGMLLLALWTGR